MAGCMLLLLLHALLLSGTTLAGENPSWRGISQSDKTFPPPPPDGRQSDEEDLMKTYGQLKSMYYSLKAKLDRKMSLQQEEKARPRTFGTNNVAMSPIFLDLDNIESFNDISSFDTLTAATEETTTVRTTTTGPIVLGQDALGRQIVRFINQWEEQINDITGPDQDTSLVTVPTTTPTTTTTATTTATTTTGPTTTVTTTQPTTTRTPVMFPSFLQHSRDEEASFPILPDPLIMGPRPPVPVFETTAAPPTPPVFFEQEREGDPLVMGPPPPPSFTPPPPTRSDFQTTSFFSRDTPSPIFDESTFPSFITEVTAPPRREADVWSEVPSPSTTPSMPIEDTIWWTPRPAFLNMSSILMAPPPVPFRPIAPQPLWHPRRKPTTLLPPLTIHPEIEPKIRKVAEQSVVNDLELAAGSLNMPELVKELRGEQQIPPVLDYLQMDKILEMKRKTLEQLEILEQLANRRNRLQDLIDNQKRLLSQARGNRIQQVEETTEIGRVELEPTEQPFGRIEPDIQIPTTISAIPEEARWPQELRKGESGKKRQQRPRHSRRPKMVDERVATVDELTQLLETELKQAQRDAKARELGELCSQTMCSFEKGDFCRFETSYDELTRRQKNKRRNTRSVEAAPIYVIRSWSNWVGSFSPNGTRVDRAPHFSPQNKRFAGVFLEPQQLASLSLTVSYADTFTVRFRAWEATKGMRLRVCCDDFCPFSTDIGKSRRKWRQLRVTCPAETRQLAFECEMIVGRRKGVCAIDDVFVEADECPAI